MSNNASLTEQGMVNGLQQTINGFLSQGVWAHLLKTPGLGGGEIETITTCLALECNFIGYAPQNLLTWSTPALILPTVGSTHYAQTIAAATFTISDPAGSGPFSGFFLTDGAFAKLYGYSNFLISNPFIIPQGETFVLNVEYNLFSYYPYPPTGPW